MGWTQIIDTQEAVPLPVLQVKKRIWVDGDWRDFIFVRVDAKTSNQRDAIHKWLSDQCEPVRQRTWWMDDWYIWMRDDLATMVLLKEF